jgi:uncharacterized Zn-binding protein involved in type VI secretion
MDFIKPTEITDSLFWGSNVPETDYQEWVGGTGVYAALSQASLVWNGMAAAVNGDIYACVDAGDIYKQTGGVGDFAALSQSSTAWRGMAAAPDGDIYACVYNGDIYKQTNGTGDFAALSQTSRQWNGMAAAPNGDIYACVDGGDIYKQTNGTGDFAALSQTSRNWRGMAADLDGNIYACVYGGDIYKQTNGTGDFAALSQTSRNWRGIAAALDGDIYACVPNTDIYKSSYVPTYSQEDQVVKDHVVYESLTNNNKNNDPATDETNWVEIGPTNRWACFDGTIGNQTSQATPVIMALAPGTIDSVALLNIESTSVEIVEIDNDDNLVTNGTAWTGATGTTQPTGWDKVGTPADYLIDGGMIKITTDAVNEGQSQTIAVSAAAEYQLLGKYKNTAGDIAQIAIYDVTHSADILATTDLASSTVESIFSQVFTTPAGCVSIKISLMGKASGDIVWFDDVTLAPTEYSETVTTGTSKTDLVKLDIPQKANGILTVTINYTAGTAKLGELIVGVKTNIGTMRYSPSIGITDYSTKTVDTFGHYSIVPRTFAKRMICSLIILNTLVDEIIRLLTLYRSTELVWVGDANYNSLIVYGFYKDFQVVFARPNSSDCSLEIEGLT